MYLYRILILLLIPSLVGFAQETADTTRVSVDDPAPNRLIIMSTGRLVEPKTGVISLHELVIGQFPYIPSGQFAYAPSENLQLSTIITPYIGVVSVGVKTRLVGPSGMFQGLAAGADVYGSTDNGALILAPMLSIAASFGVPEFTVHAGAQGGFSEGVNGGITILHLGAEADFGSAGLQGVKLMGEMFVTPIDVAGDRVGLFGVRIYGRTLCLDLAAIVMGELTFGKYEISSPSSPYLLPYLSLGWKL